MGLWSILMCWGILVGVVLFLALIWKIIALIVSKLVASDSYIMKKCSTQLYNIVANKTESEWDTNGKEARKQNGSYRIGFVRTVQQKMIHLENMGVTADTVLQRIHEQGKNPKRCDVITAIRMAVDELERSANQKLSQELSENGITPSEFFSRKSVISGDSVGVYIILNCTKSMYYVGQAKRLYFRVNQHFTGYGNGDIYADYKYGDQFRIRLITLRESGYDDLDKLERDMIKQYHANVDGYNKTSGNN